MSHSLPWLLAIATTLGSAAAQALPLGPLNTPGATPSASVRASEGCSQSRGGWSCSSSSDAGCLVSETKGGLTCLPRGEVVADKAIVN